MESEIRGYAKGVVKTLRKHNASESYIVTYLMQDMNISEDEARGYMDLVDYPPVIFIDKADEASMEIAMCAAESYASAYVKGMVEALIQRGLTYKQIVKEILGDNHLVEDNVMADGTEELVEVLANYLVSNKAKIYIDAYWKWFVYVLCKRNVSEEKIMLILDGQITEDDASNYLLKARKLKCI